MILVSSWCKSIFELDYVVVGLNEMVCGGCGCCSKKAGEEVTEQGSGA